MSRVGPRSTPARRHARATGSQMMPSPKAGCSGPRLGRRFRVGNIERRHRERRNRHRIGYLLIASAGTWVRRSGAGAARRHRSGAARRCPPRVHAADPASGGGGSARSPPASSPASHCWPSCSGPSTVPPLESGYGSLDTIFSVQHVLPNLARYPRWLVESHTPLVLLALVAPGGSLVPPPRERRPRALAAWLGAAGSRRQRPCHLRVLHTLRRLGLPPLPAAGGAAAACALGGGPGGWTAAVPGMAGPRRSRWPVSGRRVGSGRGRLASRCGLIRPRGKVEGARRVNGRGRASGAGNRQAGARNHERGDRSGHPPPPTAIVNRRPRFGVGAGQLKRSGACQIRCAVAADAPGPAPHPAGADAEGVHALARSGRQAALAFRTTRDVLRFSRPQLVVRLPASAAGISNKACK